MYYMYCNLITKEFISWNLSSIWDTPGLFAPCKKLIPALTTWQQKKRTLWNIMKLWVNRRPWLTKLLFFCFFCVRFWNNGSKFIVFCAGYIFSISGNNSCRLSFVRNMKLLCLNFSSPFVLNCVLQLQVIRLAVFVQTSPTYVHELL